MHMQGLWLIFLLFIQAIHANSASFDIENCPKRIQEQFYDVSLAPGAGADCDDMQPEVRVTCNNKHLIIESNAIPSFTMNNTTPNHLKEAPFTARIPLKPTLADQITPIADENGTPLLGYLGFTVTGIPIYGPTEANIPPGQAYGSPIYNCIVAMASNKLCAPGKNTKPGCGAHTGARSYHYHFIEEACFQGEKSLIADPWTLPVDPEEPSGIVGYAADGFPIYGRYEHLGGDEKAEVIQVHSSYLPVDGKNPSSLAFKAYTYHKFNNPYVYLDECNGHTHNGQYHYHATDEFPYILGCFKGKPLGVGKIRPENNSMFSTIKTQLANLVGMEHTEHDGTEEFACH